MRGGTRDHVSELVAEQQPSNPAGHLVAIISWTAEPATDPEHRGYPVHNTHTELPDDKRTPLPSPTTTGCSAGWRPSPGGWARSARGPADRPSDTGRHRPALHLTLLRSATGARPTRVRPGIEPPPAVISPPRLTAASWRTYAHRRRVDQPRQHLPSGDHPPGDHARLAWQAVVPDVAQLRAVP